MLSTLKIVASQNRGPPQTRYGTVDDEEDECLSEEEESGCTDDESGTEEEDPAPMPEAVDVVAEEEAFKKALRNCLDAMNCQGLQDQNLPKPTNAALDPNTARLR